MAISDSDMRRFKDSLSKCLAEVERHALEELGSMNEALVSLRAENAELRTQLGSQSLAVTPLGKGLNQNAMETRREDGAVPSLGLGTNGFTNGTNGQESLCNSARHGGGDHPSSIPLSSRSSLGLPGENSRKANADMRGILARRKSTLSGVVYKDRGYAQRMVRSPVFEYITLTIVLVNALWIALDLDLNGKPLLDSPLGFQLIEQVFTLVFFLEMVVRLLAYRRPLLALQDKWFIFDGILVFTMTLESWLLTIIFLITDAKELMGIGFLSALRILRVLRIVRVAKLCKAAPELKTMVAGIVAGIRSMLITAVILVVVTYAFAVCLRQLGMSTAWGQEHFTTVPNSVYTLLIVSLLPDNAPLMDEISQETWYCGVIYFIFLLLTAVTIMNMLIGILVDGIFQVSNADKEERGIELMSEKLRAALWSIDKNFDGQVSKAEFEGILENQEAVRTLYDVGVDVTALVSEADFIFRSECSSGLPFEDFKEEVLKFRATSVATNGSVTAVQRFMRFGLEQLAEKMDDLKMTMVQGPLVKPHLCAQANHQPTYDI
mmetsp:Transcript_26932/g.80254  ORF Transcript_26932/g.80254 Transcript_26932/m.80254 type:complete len:549 (-) Transcript_26932:83-1729(-)